MFGPHLMIPPTLRHKVHSRLHHRTGPGHLSTNRRHPSCDIPPGTSHKETHPTMSTTPKKLTVKQARFVDEYVIDGNATRAAEAAGYSPRTAFQTGYENLRKPEIAEAIAAKQAETAKRNELTRDEIIKGLRAEANYHGSGAQHMARVKAWETLGKIAGVVTNRTEVSGPDGGPIKIEALAGLLAEEFENAHPGDPEESR